MTGLHEVEPHECIVRIPIVEQKQQSMTAPSSNAILEGNLIIPKAAEGIVVFAHGSGSSRHSPRNQYVAQVLNNAGLATLLTDLLTREEEEVDIKTRQHRFNIDLLSERLIAVTDWIIQNPDTQKLFVGYFGASTGAARHWPQRLSVVILLAPLYRAVGGLTWLGLKLLGMCKHRLCLL